jgi:hypothetical protein
MELVIELTEAELDAVAGGSGSASFSFTGSSSGTNAAVSGTLSIATTASSARLSGTFSSSSTWSPLRFMAAARIIRAAVSWGTDTEPCVSAGWCNVIKRLWRNHWRRAVRTWHSALKELLAEHEDASAFWLYTQALVAFRESGASNEQAAALVRDAWSANEHVPPS